MKIGYARKSTHLQDVAHQVDELTKAGCEQIYQDQTSRSGPKRDKKGAPELENCLKALREGDTLVVWALDRLGGSLGQVITLLDDLKKRGITFIAIKDRIDTNAPVIGEIYTHLMAIFSSFERNRNIERTRSGRHCCKVSDEAAFCLIQRPYISKTLLTRRISPRGSP
ncbi:recombinase family protein [Klebsiella pneumoniae]|uniref:recombinase family protein n=2 Tax=Klebsiella pneumoniae TaxID=573 RepID=UPI001FF1984B|nr:recombinase family protein [Klebsiella pneumoniae]MDZ1652597.1 recombinase family protein [Klebsiella pneumoniae]MDZ1674252.1 recombinase family protein [Klebsiella pneumoniae]MDZ3611778.1 recombinase family protein [Klebsiella pneumoniae]MDZ3778120.1 recombinase family protein [Klebsiella pneumoniae]UOZ34766.1 recombinase family protein [Klebsiella pneumoniae]